ncbi:MAG: hypothetical protein A2Y61_05485 [Chloroflexi bacterium RBG_13_60_13]|nr:MAG: hypothetical protein A2Y61_05485 [Chloroflexi bacterium RBG_13_60_13]
MRGKGRILPVMALLAALMATGLAVAACGGDGQETSPTASLTAVVSPTQQVTQTQSPPTETVSPTPTESVSPTATVSVSPTPPEDTCSDTPKILRPQPGETVPMETEVEFRVSPPESGDQHPQVLVRPMLPNQDYWVQRVPTQEGNCDWLSRPVHVGEGGDRGLTFRVCAVVTDEVLTLGQRVFNLPQGPSDCVEVIRE